MKNLLLKSITLVSHKEKKAKTVSFHPKKNLVVGQNDTGKSCLLKSIYYCFGAEPQNLHHDWIKADVSILLKFSVDGINYAIYRSSGLFGLFDCNGKMLNSFGSITLELGPAIAELLNFKLRLIDRQGEARTPTPSYLLLPFYIDQDGGWVNPWNSFKGLQQFANWKKTLVEYFVGLRPNEWYDLDIRRGLAKNRLEEPEGQLKVIRSILETKLDDLQNYDFNINILDFKEEIKALLSESNKLKKDESRYKARFVELQTQKIRLEAQVDIVTKTHDELSKDYKYSLATTSEQIECPTCGADHNNNFAERFSIASDTATCHDLLADLRVELNKIEKRMAQVDSELKANKERRSRIDKALTTKKGKIRLKDIIRIQGKKEVISQLREDEKKQLTQIAEITQELAEIELSMDSLDDKSRKAAIKKNYSNTFKRHARALNVTSLKDTVFANLTPKINETGSDLPRAILAYQFAILELITNNESIEAFPLVIDAPNQQEQDEVNLPAVLNFISSKKPSAYQLILGLVDTANVDFSEFKTIELNDKLSLLKSSSYGDGCEIIHQYETSLLLS